MKQYRSAYFACLAVLLLAQGERVFARSIGAAAGFSGAPGDALCTQCHQGTAANAGPGQLTIAFANGATYAPNQTKRVTVTINHPTARRWGFEATPRLVSDAQTRGAGNLVIVNDQTLLHPPRETLQWITHTAAGTRNGAVGPVTFEFDWTAPSSNVGDVDFYVAANAANGNGANSGDEIYSTKMTVRPAAVSGERPSISQNGVTNGASFAPGMAAGAWITIKGNNLASTTRLWGSSDFSGNMLPMSLDGTRVTINGKPAAVYYISPTQINALAPTDESLGSVPVVVTTANGESNTMTADLQRYSPALFQFDPQQRRYAAAVYSDGTLVAPTGLFGSNVASRPARAGDVILLYGTGFGPTNPAVPTDRIFTGAAPLTTTPTVTLGGAPVTVQFAGISGVGLYQFNLVIPSGLSAGDHLIRVSIGGLSTLDGIYLATQ